MSQPLENCIGGLSPSAERSRFRLQQRRISLCIAPHSPNDQLRYSAAYGKEKQKM